MDREAWHAVIHGVAKSQAWLNDWTELKQGDNIQPWCTPFPIWNHSIFPCPILTVASWTAHRFLKRQFRWSGMPIAWRIFKFVVIHTLKGFGVVNKAEVDVFLEYSCFFDDPADVGSLISGSSAFSESNLNIWRFLVRILLNRHLENFEHYFTSMWDDCNCVVVWAFLALPFFGIGMKTDLFQSCGLCCAFQICWQIECSMLTASSSRIWNNSAGIHHLH